MTIQVIVNGAQGKMGQETVKALSESNEFNVVAQATIGDDFAAILDKTRPQICVDFTSAESIFQNTVTMIQKGVHPVIGTTGMAPEKIKELQTIAAEKKLGGIIAPNFSIGAVLMMRFSKLAAKYYDNVEIIEYHHDSKADSPSGTAIKTAEMIAETKSIIANKKTTRETIAGARGATHHNIAIHAVRLPGIVADQEVIFGGKGETLRIHHRSIHREAFMPGVLLACKKVLELKKLVYGLESIL